MPTPSRMQIETDPQGRRRIRLGYQTWNLHNHLRDPEEDQRFITCLVFTLLQWNVSNAMCNFRDPIRTVARAQWYYERIKEVAARLGFPDFEPMLAPMWTEDTTPDDIYGLADLPFVMGMKTMPKHGSTNTAHGIPDFFAQRFQDGLEALRDVNRSKRHFPWLVHAEVPDPAIPRGKREAPFIPILREHHSRRPEIPISIEHISSRVTTAFIDECAGEVIGTITPHHPMTTGAMADQDVHHQCMPYPGEPEDMEAILAALLSGYCWYAFGSDNAPHLKQKHKVANKASGVFTALNELAVLATLLARHNALHLLEGLVCVNGPTWHQKEVIPVENGIELTEQEWVVPEEIPAGDDTIVPHLHGQPLSFCLTRDARGQTVVHPALTA